MLIRRMQPFGKGYTPIVTSDGPNRDMLLDFGILVLEAGERYEEADPERERAYLLMNGEAELDGGAGKVAASRSSLLDETPWTLHVSRGTTARIVAKSRCELALEAKTNPKAFATRIYTPAETRSEQFGAGTLRETATRTVRTVFDAATHSDSHMVIGEVINHPGKWSSFPTHGHPHPEIYHYRFFPKNGFGFSGTGEEVVRVTDGDTVAIPGGLVHPQVAAPGYAMYYLWMIPHLPGNRFGPDSRIFDEEHAWLLDPDAPIWDGPPAATHEKGRKSK